MVEGWVLWTSTGKMIEMVGKNYCIPKMVIYYHKSNTLPKTNSSHLKMDGSETSLSFWVSAYFQWLLLLV